MLQRAMIAMAIACEPTILIADEPTTAFDVTIQAQILDLLNDLQQETQMSIILITHDLGVVARMVDEVIVMYAGQVVEHGSVDDIFYRSAHPYTLGLRGAMPTNNREQSNLIPIDGSPPDLFQAPPVVLRALPSRDENLSKRRVCHCNHTANIGPVAGCTTTTTLIGRHHCTSPPEQPLNNP